MTTLREAAQQALEALEDYKYAEARDALRAALAEPVQEQDIEDAIEAAYWHFDARRSGLNEWASAPQSDRDAFKAEARKLVRGYFPARQAQDTKREKLAVADAFIRGYWDGFNIGEREGRIEAEDAAQQAEPVQERHFCSRCGKRTQDIHTCTPP